jgi:hypothetical protein
MKSPMQMPSIAYSGQCSAKTDLHIRGSAAVLVETNIYRTRRLQFQSMEVAVDDGRQTGCNIQIGTAIQV